MNNYYVCIVKEHSIDTFHYEKGERIWFSNEKGALLLIQCLGNDVAKIEED